MKLTLIIVESPNKCKTIEKFLNSSKYKVVATNGHIRDLSISGKDGLGVDCENNFKPSYSIIKNKKKIVKELQKEAEKADKIILATDPDREGEAIAWHISEVLNLKNSDRSEFHEITEKTVKKSLENPRKINNNLVCSQEARRILDRIIGFKLSKTLQKNTNSKSGGRVQSAVLKIIVDREKEISSFKPEEFFEIKIIFQNNNKEDIETDFYTYCNKAIKLSKKEIVDEIIEETKKEKIQVLEVIEKEKLLTPPTPLTTSLLQQEAITKFNFPSYRISKIAQELYEGIKIKDEIVGLVTYIRTDSTRLNNDYIKETEKKIEKEFGKEYVSKKKEKKQKNKKSKFIQDAHEAIRPTNNNYEPKKIKNFLTNDQYKIYKLIYERTLSSLMSEKKEKITTYIIGNDKVKYKISTNKVIFFGFDIFNKDKILNNNKELLLKKNDILKIKKINVEKKQTKPPSHFSEASIIKTMEKEGIGRPSTYSSTIINLFNRLYIIKKNGSIIPTKIGEDVICFLEKKFPDIVNVKFTAEMEEDLDKIKNGEDKNNIIRKIYNNFIKEWDIADKEKIGVCPNCGHDLKSKRGKNGYFIGCSNYPNCKYTNSIKHNTDEILERKCPKCGKNLVKRISIKRKKYFIGCSNFPKCNYIENIKQTKKNKNSIK